MRQILNISFLLSLILILGSLTPAQAAVVGSGQPLSSLVESSAGVLGVDQDGIWLSTDNGESFVNVFSDPSDVFYALASSLDTVVAVGESGLVLRSTNGGNDWAEVPTPGLFGDLISVATDGNGVWLATGDPFGAQLLRSSDNGQTWAEVTPPTATGLRSIAWHVDAGWILAGEGDSFTGIIYRSMDNGDNWQLLADNLAAPINALAVNSVGGITAVGESGLILQGTTSSSFVAPIGYSPISQDLFAAIATSSDSFQVGGESGALLAVNVLTPEFTS